MCHRRIERRVVLTQAADSSSQKHKNQLKRLSENLAGLMARTPAQTVNLQSAVHKAVVDWIGARDDVTGGHVARTQAFLRLLINQMIEDGVYADEALAWDLDSLLSSVRLHDIGKVAIKDAILDKNGPLTPKEYKIIKRHVSAGMKVIRKIRGNADENEFLHHSNLITGSHHERWDGSGYPLGLKGLDIPLEGRLMAIADVYDALISRRCYKDPIGADEVRRAIESGAGTQFDPALIAVFSKLADKFADIVDGVCAS